MLRQSSGILGMFLLQDDCGFETHKHLFLSILVSNEYHVRRNLNVSAIDYIIKYIYIFAQKFGTYIMPSRFPSAILFDRAKIFEPIGHPHPKTIIKRVSLCPESLLNFPRFPPEGMDDPY